MLFQDGDDRASKVAGLKAGSRVVPYEEGGNMEEISEIGGGSERFQTGYKDEGLSEIRSQLLQIENQQSSLLDLIQVISFAWLDLTLYTLIQLGS